MSKIKPSNSLKLLKNIMTLGRHSEVVDIGGIKFEIGTLTEKENSELLSSLISLDEQTRVVMTKSYAVAMSIQKINEESFEDVLDYMEDIPDSITTMFSKKVYFINCLQTKVVDKLFEEYSKFSDEDEEDSENPLEKK